MDKWTFDKVDNIISTTSNTIFGNLQTKQQARENLLNTVILSCYAYKNDADFRKTIDILKNKF